MSSTIAPDDAYDAARHDGGVGDGGAGRPAGPGRAQPVAAPAHPHPLSLPVAVVARQLGVAPATLRTWDLRYGVGPSERAAGQHRRYTGDDLARLQHMRSLVLRGVAPADAAAATLAAHASAASATPPAATPPARRSTGRSAPHGGRVLALRGAEATVRGLARAAMSLDEDTVRAQVLASLRASGVVATWEGLLRPVLRSVGERWARTGEGVEVEHLLSAVVTAVLAEASAPAPTTPTATAPGRSAGHPAAGQDVLARPVVLAGVEGDQHALPLHVLGAALAERGLAARVLGASLPAASLRAAAHRLGAGAVVVWSQLPGTASPSALDGMPPTRPPIAVFAAGPGWDAASLPTQVRLLDDLASAVAVLQAAVGAGQPQDQREQAAGAL